jgi:hypothetical protein
VQPMSKLDVTTLDDEKLSDEDLKRHRVGGRLVTRREIMRSKKCMFFKISFVNFSDRVGFQLSTNSQSCSSIWNTVKLLPLLLQ